MGRLEERLDSFDLAHRRQALRELLAMAERGQIPCVRWQCPGDGETKPRTMVRFKKSDVMRFIDVNYMAST